MADECTPTSKELVNSSEVNCSRRHFLIVFSSLLGGIAAFFSAIPFFSALNPSRRILKTSGPIEVDLDSIQPGQIKTVTWRGKPVWILKRTSSMISALQKPNPELRDPNSLVNQQPTYAQNSLRSRRPDVAVFIGICTHLGCIPKYQPKKDFLCPCHGSVFDLAGRVYKGVPAPINLEVPPYAYISDNRIRIGE